MWKSCTLPVVTLIIALFSIVAVRVIQGDSDYINAGLKKHNELRAKHGAVEMKIDNSLNDKADACARYYIKINKIDHSCPDRGIKGAIGENLWRTSSKKGEPDAVVVDAIQSWYNEIKDYSFKTNAAKNNGVVGHFTQLVWNSSKLLGIGYGKDNAKGQFVVALYSPHGNYKKLFKKNVFPLPSASTGSKTVSGFTTILTLITIAWLASGCVLL